MTASRRLSPRRLVPAIFLVLVMVLILTAPAAGGNPTRRPSAQTTRGLITEGVFAMLRGTINAHGSYTNWYFQWGPTKAYGQIAEGPVEEASAGDKPEEVEEPIECLRPQTHYHFRIVAYNHFGTAYGRDMTFKTKGLPYGRTAAYRNCPGHKPIA
jgi:hypothetical protein